MLNYFIVLILLVTQMYTPVKSQEKNKMSDITQIISEVQNKYAPDKRVAIFQITAMENNDLFVLEGSTNLPLARQELLSLLKERNISCIDSIRLLPDQKLGTKIYGIINLSVGNIRTKPDMPEELATQALLGTVVNVLQEHHGWYLVQTPDEYISWVDEDAVELVSGEEALAWKRAPKVILMIPYGFSFINPDQKSQTVSDLVEGNLLKLLGEENDYYKVEYPDKRIAYIPLNNAMKYDEWLSKIELKPEVIIKTAKTFMGIPYLWGGTSMKGVDCSGFTKSVYYLNGVILPRDASQQVNVGELVDTRNGFDNLKPGDLVFFGRRATADRKERATHVGIYIGNGEYIHSSGRVRINSFNKDAENYNQYRFNSFLKARRILTSLDKDGVYLLKNHKSYAEVIK